MLMAGMIVTLKVLRETDISYLLTNGIEEIFLHKKEALHAYQPSDEVQVFLYVDHQGRLAATPTLPLVDLEKGAFLEVVGVTPSLGVFLHNGIVKDLLLSKDDLPFSYEDWPQKGDRLFVTMKLKKDKLFARQPGRKQIIDYYHEEPPLLKEGAEVDAFVQYLVEEGIVAFTDSGIELFIHRNNMRSKVRLGEKIHPRILKQQEPHTYGATLIERKESMMDQDASILLRYMDLRGGVMRFTDKSDPEDIQAAFHMSKSAFKRALGNLYKQGLVELLSDRTQRKSK